MQNVNLIAKFHNTIQNKTLKIKCKKGQLNQSNHPILLDLKNPFTMTMKNPWGHWGQWIVVVLCLNWMNLWKTKGSIWNNKLGELRGNLKNNS